MLYSKTLERWRFTLRQAARERLAQGNRSNRMAKAALILKNSNQRAAYAPLGWSQKVFVCTSYAYNMCVRILRISICFVRAMYRTLGGTIPY